MTENQEEITHSINPETSGAISNQIRPSEEIVENKKVPESQITELKEEKPKMQEFIEFIRDLIIIIFFVFIIRSYLVAPFQIQ